MRLYNKLWISLGTRNESLNWYSERAVSVQAGYYWAPYVGCAQTRSEMDASFLRQPSDHGKLILKGGWTAEQLKVALPKKLVTVSCEGKIKVNE